MFSLGVEDAGTGDVFEVKKFRGDSSALPTGSQFVVASEDQFETRRFFVGD